MLPAVVDPFAINGSGRVLGLSSPPLSTERSSGRSGFVIVLKTRRIVNRSIEIDGVVYVFKSKKTLGNMVFGSLVSPSE